MRCAWFGTGLLGKPMAEQLLRDGHEVRVWNRTRAKAAALAAAGAQVGATPQETIAESQYVFSMLADAAAIDSVVFQQAFPAGEADWTNRVLIQMGTISPDESIDFAERVRRSGGTYLEAPVLGSIPQAVARQLIVMVGAERADFERHESILAAFGSKRVFVGEVGQAAALKLALNHLIAALTTSFSLSLGLVRRRGLDAEMFLSILRDSSLYAPTFDKKLPKMLQRDFSDANFPAKHMLKDVRLVAAEAAHLGLSGELLRALEATLLRAVELGHADSDYSAVYEAVDPPS